MFPTTDSNLCAQSLVEQVLSLYALGAIRGCRLHHRGLNDTYKVEGSQGDTYFLRIYRVNWRSREEIEAEIAILLHLACEKASVSIPVSRKDGQVITPLDSPKAGGGLRCSRVRRVKKSLPPMLTTMSWLDSTEKRSQRFIPQRIALRGAALALPLVLQNCSNDRCSSSHQRLLTVLKTSPMSMDWVIFCDIRYREWPTSRLVSAMATFMGGMPVKGMVLLCSMTSTAVAGVIEPTTWPSFRGRLRFVKIPPTGSRQWVVRSSRDTCGDAHLVPLTLMP